MLPVVIGRSYDALASTWQDRHRESGYGLAQYQRALQFAKVGFALEIGCGSSGRIVDLLRQRGYQVEGIDVSEKMVCMIRDLHPESVFQHADIVSWKVPRRYDFIAAWDSIWHLPLSQQEPVLRKIAGALAPHGVLLFTMGGLDEPEEKTDSFMGPVVPYSTLGVPMTLEILARSRCVCRHLEFDQFPEKHLYVVAQRLP